MQLCDKRVSMCTVWSLERIFSDDVNYEGERHEKIVLNESLDCYRVGRARYNEINCLSTYVSRSHCNIVKKDKGLYIIDGGSSNGTYINGSRILPNREIPLEVGDLIGLGVPEIIDARCYIYALRKEFSELKNEENIIVLSDTDVDDYEGVVSVKPLQCNTEVPRQGATVEENRLLSETQGECITRKRPSDISHDVPSKVPRKSGPENNQVIDSATSDVYRSDCSVIKEEPYVNNNNSAMSCDIIKEVTDITCMKETLADITRQVESDAFIHGATDKMLVNITDGNRVTDSTVSTSVISDGNLLSERSEITDSCVKSSEECADRTYKRGSQTGSTFNLKSENEGNVDGVIESRGIHVVNDDGNNSQIDSVLAKDTVEDTSLRSIRSSEHKEILEHSLSKICAPEKVFKEPFSKANSETNSSKSIGVHSTNSTFHTNISSDSSEDKHKLVSLSRIESKSIDLPSTNSTALTNVSSGSSKEKHTLPSLSRTEPLAKRKEIFEKSCKSDYGETNACQDMEKVPCQKDQSALKLKDLVIKVEKLSEAEVKQHQINENAANENANADESMLNYTLDDDIIVISDDEEMFPSSQLFNEPLLVKQEVLEENDISCTTTDAHQDDMEAIDCDIGGITIPIDDDSDDDGDGDNWFRKLSQTYHDSISDEELEIKKEDKISIHPSEHDKNIEEINKVTELVGTSVKDDVFEETRAQEEDDDVTREFYTKPHLESGPSISDKFETEPCDEAHASNMLLDLPDEGQNDVVSNKNFQDLADKRDYEETASEKSKGIISRKPIIIEAPHMKKVRSRERLPPSSKMKPKEQKAVSLDICASAPHRESSLKQKRLSKKKRNSSSNASAIPLNEKKEITEARKKRLKEIAENKKKDEDTKEVKRNATLRVKVTERNRGAFLTESLPISSARSGKEESNSVKKFVKDDVLNISRTESLCDSSKTGASSSTSAIPESVQAIVEGKTSSTELSGKRRESKSSNKEPEKKISSLPRIPRLRSLSSGPKGCDQISPLQDSPQKCTRASNSAVSTSTSANAETLLTTKTPKKKRIARVSRTNKATNETAPQKSCLKQIGSTLLKTSQKSKRVSFSGNLTHVKIFEIQDGAHLRPVGSIKDAPLPNLPPVNRGTGSSESESFLNEVINIICQWNPKWLEEQKVNSVPPPLTSMKLYPMLSYFKTYEDYKKVLLPLMLHDVWESITKDMEGTKNAGRSGTKIFMLEEVTATVGGLVCLTCSATLSHQELLQNHHPKFGDLLLAEAQVQNSGPISDITASQDFRGGRCFANAFAYVQNMNTERSSRNTFNQSFKTSFQSQQTQQEVRLILRLLVKARAYKTGTNLRIKIISYLRSDLRQFQALAVVPKSPLCRHILSPNLRDYHLPHVEGNKLWTKENLNEKQAEIILKCAEVCRHQEPKVCLIQGPPGTGKSTVIKNLVMQILYGRNDYRRNWRKANHRCPRILLCAPSNAAVDELVDRLLIIRQAMPKEERFKMVRVGKTLRPSVHAISLDELAKKDVRNAVENLSGDPESLDLEFRCLDAKEKSYQMAYESPGITEVSRQALTAKIAAVQAKRKLLEQKRYETSSSSNRSKQLADERMAQINILRGADVIATTLNSCFSVQMEGIFGLNAKERIQLTCCIVDEATQCSEPESLIPLLLGINCLVLVGDPEQLPATVISQEAKKLGLGQSMFARLRSCFESQEKTAVQMLNVQYRMHPEICLWPNQYFYMNQLENSPGIAERRRSPLLPYVILSLQHTQDRSGQIRNPGEAAFVTKLARLVVNSTSRKMRVGIIAPYNKQRQEIFSQFQSCPISEMNLIDVHTIDSSQGLERDIVVISCTRTDGVGFLTNTERLNVAVTRARYSLIICGNFTSLKTDNMWKSLITNAVERKCFKTVLPTMSDTDILSLIMSTPH
ncbi:uncharacterized protein LOC126473983 [Schistocerca serialis cubense]|uniref:uncharacterized protein LOC126473983 n=1 Tax=Schistocerca serialis cubense TaxID=2023355 RepID=UPI00214E5C59|nr:uncharacterized protein LOC126473983 [Schistocerca serialis cubense]